MLFAGRGVEVDRYAAGNDLRNVVAKVEIAGGVVNDQQHDQEYEEGEPTSFQTKAASGEPEGAHGIALHNGRMTAVAAYGEAEEQSARSLPAEVEAPADP